MSDHHNSFISNVQVNRRDDITTLTHVSMSGEEREWSHSESAKIGVGRDGKVYLQTSSMGNRKRAVKIADKPNRHNKIIEEEIREEEIREIYNHSTIAKIFKSTSCFVQLLGVYQDEHHYYLAMEYLVLGDLSQHALTKGQHFQGRLEEDEILRIVRQILEAIEHLHSKQFAHRDLKPQNILVAQGRPDWHIKVADFGFAKHVIDTSLYTSGGTGQYRAPEQKDRMDVSYGLEVDIWACGVITRELVEGKDMPDLGRYHYSKPSWPPLRHDMQNTYTQMLERDPLKRPSPRRLLNEISRAQAGQHATTHQIAIVHPRSNAPPTFTSPSPEISLSSSAGIKQAIVPKWDVPLEDSPNVKISKSLYLKVYQWLKSPNNPVLWIVLPTRCRLIAKHLCCHLTHRAFTKHLPLISYRAHDEATSSFEGMLENSVFQLRSFRPTNDLSDAQIEGLNSLEAFSRQLRQSACTVHGVFYGFQDLGPSGDTGLSLVQGFLEILLSHAQSVHGSKFLFVTEGIDERLERTLKPDDRFDFLVKKAEIPLQELEFPS